MNASRARLAVAAVVGAAVLVAGFLVRPAVPAIDGPPTGDARLWSTVERLHDGPRHRMAVAIVDQSQTRFAGIGAHEHAPFEIGSVTKGLNGILLADAVARREVRLDQPVGDLLPLGDSPIGEVTLEELATQRSGLPRTAGGLQPSARGILARLRGADPYPYDVDELLDHARAANLDGRGKPAYSNVGGALLGQALAAARKTTYRELLTDRLFEPLQLGNSRVPEGLRDAAPEGFDTGGRRQAPWVSEGYAAAGSVVSSSADLATLARALLAGQYAEALKPRRDFEDEGERIGLFWISSELPGTDRTMVWHNGGTGGYSAFVGLDPERRRAVVVLSDVAGGVNELATDLLREA